MSRPHIDVIRKAGVIGAGGAGFPTHVKLDASVEFILGNGAECEPLLRADQQIMDQFAPAVVRGIEIAMESTGAKKADSGLKKKYKKAIISLNSALKSVSADIEVFPLNDFYPAGDEFVLLHEILGRNIPEAGLPLHVGAVTNNVSTLRNISRAVDLGVPVSSAYVTITGAGDSTVRIEATSDSRAGTSITASGAGHFTVSLDKLDDLVVTVLSAGQEASVRLLTSPA